MKCPSSKTVFASYFLYLSLILAAAAAAIAAARPGGAGAVGPGLQKYLASHPAADRVPVWVFFIDKGITSAGRLRRAVDRERAQISERALSRRSRVRAGVERDDLPVHGEYISAVRTAGLELRRTSRWLNAVSGNVPRERLSELSALPHVKSVRLLRQRRPRRPDLEAQIMTDYGLSRNQLELINVPAAHAMGYSGYGVLIALLDTGFSLEHEALSDVDIAAEYDFIFDDEDTRNDPAVDELQQDTHGTAVLSVIGGRAPERLIGPAFNASYLLAKTEDVRGETVIEEDHWVSAIEWAERLGADIVSSSLGYYDWYKYEDMDGNTAVTTVAADRAVAKGMVVCVSAGNERKSAWRYITAPADADSVIAVGAVNSKGVITAFSSAGPTADGRIKPEVVAQGSGVVAANARKANDYLSTAGTSMSAPLVAGAAALVIEAHPRWTPMQVRQALISTADRATQPDNLYGYGLVDAAAAIEYRQDGDVNGDDCRDLADLLSAAEIALESGPALPQARRAADLNKDDRVDVLDLVELARTLKP